MRLKTFHLLFISVCSLLAFFFGGWSWHAYSASGTTSHLLSAIAAFAAGAGLIAYGLWFRRKITTVEEEKRRRRKLIQRVPVAAIVWLLAVRAAPACTVCFGDAEGPMIDAARMGVWLLFGMTLLVQSVFAYFFIQLWRRARNARR